MINNGGCRYEWEQEDQSEHVRGTGDNITVTRTQGGTRPQDSGGGGPAKWPLITNYCSYLFRNQMKKKYNDLDSKHL